MRNSMRWAACCVLACLAACGSGPGGQEAGDDCTVLSAKIDLPVRRVALEVKFVGLEPGGLDALGLAPTAFETVTTATGLPLGGAFCGSGKVAAPSTIVGGVDGGLNAVGDDQLSGGVFPVIGIGGSFPQGADEGMGFVGGPGSSFNLDPFAVDPITNLLYSLDPPSPAPLSVPSGFDLGFSELTDSEAASLIAAIKADFNRSLIEPPHLTTIDGQSAVIITNEAELPKSEFQAEFQQAANAFDSSLATMHTGTSILVTPTLSTGDTVTVGIRPTAACFGVGPQPLDVNGQSSRIKMPMIQVHQVQVSPFLTFGNWLAVLGVRASASSSLEDGVPFLDNVPVVGTLFESERRIKSNQNLIILIKATLLPP